MYWTNQKNYGDHWSCTLMLKEDVPLLIAVVYETKNNRYIAMVRDFDTNEKLCQSNDPINNFNDAMDLAKEKAQTLTKYKIKQKEMKEKKMVKALGPKDLIDDSTNEEKVNNAIELINNRLKGYPIVNGKVEVYIVNMLNKKEVQEVRKRYIEAGWKSVMTKEEDYGVIGYILHV